jgi:hypothetical protein
MLAAVMSLAIAVPASANDPSSSRACTMEVKLCPDGSAVSRIVPNCAFAACPSSASTGAARSEGLNSVSPANPEIINGIQDAKDWKNPWLEVRGDGIYVVGSKGPLTIKQTEQLLLALPSNAWPLGRLVVVSQNPLQNPADRAKMNANQSSLISMLKSHQIEINFWPSG